MIMSPETPKPHCRSNKDQNQAFETHFDSIDASSRNALKYKISLQKPLLNIFSMNRPVPLPSTAPEFPIQIECGKTYH